MYDRKAFFYFGRNRNSPKQPFFISAETDTETEINFHSFFSNFWSDLFQESRISYKNIFKSYKICFLRLFWYDFCRKYNFLEKYHSRNGWKNSENVFWLLTETEVLFRPIPKPKVVLQFRQNRNSAKMAEIRPKTETESVSVVHYTIFMILLTLWNSEQKNGLLIKLFCFSSDFD